MLMLSLSSSAFVIAAVDVEATSELLPVEAADPQPVSVAITAVAKASILIFFISLISCLLHKCLQT
jgi:hypothetical protein